MEEKEVVPQDVVASGGIKLPMMAGFSPSTEDVEKTEHGE